MIPGDASEGPVREATVLVADDDATKRGFLAALLRSAGYEVIEATDGDRAVALIAQTRPDLVVCDVRMPGRSGFEVCQWIRDTPGMAETPVMLVSAQMDARFLTTPRGSGGPDAYLTVPIDHEEFRTQVRALLNASRLDPKPKRDAVDRRRGGSGPSTGPHGDEAAPAPMSRVTRRAVGRLGLRAQVASVVIVLVAGVAGVGAVGWNGLSHLAASDRDLFEHQVTASRLSALRLQLESAQVAALTLIMTNDLRLQAAIDRQIHEVIGTEILRELERLRNAPTFDEDDVPGDELELLATGWYDLAEFVRTPEFFLTTEDGATPEGNDALARKTNKRFAVLTDAIDELTQTALDDAARLSASGASVDNRARMQILRTSLVAVLIGVALAFWVAGGLVSRTRSYARFAVEVASRSSRGRLDPSGRDELTELGHALNAMVDEQAEAHRAQVRREEYTASLQMVADESESYAVLRRHLERVVPESTVVVLARDTSANRLEACTPLAAGSALERRLDGAAPASCLAVRTGQTHSEALDAVPLATCDLCHGVSGATTCEPLLIAGEVIGSVLTSTPTALDVPARAVVHDTIVQAAPVIANLRNLAVAQQRATVDLLTGMATRRAMQEALPRFAAQAARQTEPLAAAMLDLDHFKEVNDTYGHDIGDQILARTGEAIRSSIRASDYGARYGGEEFVVLFPATRAVEAAVAVDKIRRAIADVRVPGGPPSVSASVGIAVLPDDAPDGDGLLKKADRALYAAKRAGRDRICIAADVDREADPGRDADRPMDADLQAAASSDDPMLD